MWTFSHRGRDAIGHDLSGDLEAAAFIRANLPLEAIPGLGGVRLHRATPSSGLRRFLDRHGSGSAAPYWAWPWAGGLALARHLLAQPQVVAGRRVLDLGAGGGVVAIAAARAGAREVLAADVDPHAIAALVLNTEANGVEVTAVLADLTSGPPPDVDLVCVGDLFYAPELALEVAAFLERCVAAGADVLVGDPWRADLPRARLRLLAEYEVPDFADGQAAAARPSGVFAFEPKAG